MLECSPLREFKLYWISERDVRIGRLSEILALFPGRLYLLSARLEGLSKSPAAIQGLVVEPNPRGCGDLPEDERKQESPDRNPGATLTHVFSRLRSCNVLVAILLLSKAVRGLGGGSMSR